MKEERLHYRLQPCRRPQLLQLQFYRSHRLQGLHLYQALHHRLRSDFRGLLYPQHFRLQDQALHRLKSLYFAR